MLKSIIVGEETFYAHVHFVYVCVVVCVCLVNYLCRAFALLLNSAEICLFNSCLKVHGHIVFCYSYYSFLNVGESLGRIRL